MKKLLTLTASITLLLTFSGCGYTLSHGRSAGHTSSQTASVKAAIPLFVNDTFEPLIEKDVTAALQEEVEMDGRWALVDRDKADVLVEGRVTVFDLQPLSYDAKERILEYRLKVRAEIKVSYTKTGKVAWKDFIETWADYRVTEDVTKTKLRREEAKRKASNNMAGEFIIKVLDTF